MHPPQEYGATVCDDGWDRGTDAQVVCRQLGFSMTGALMPIYGHNNIILNAHMQVP